MQKTVALPTVTSKFSYLPGLTGIRAIAAYMVYLVHFDPFEQYKNQTTSIYYFFHNILQNFGIGVTIFFVLSGFLITLRYYGSIKLNNDWLRIYIINRIARIYPMYFLITLITFIVLSYNPSYDYMGQYNLFNSFERFITQLLNFTLLKGFFDNFKFTGVAQGWSLTVEECFYLSAPFFLYLINMYRKKIFIYPIILLSLGLLLTLIFSKYNLFGFFGNYNFLFSFTFFGRCFEFFAGIYLALIIKHRKDSAFVFTKGHAYTISGFCIIIFFLLSMTLAGIYMTSTLSWIVHVVINNFALPIAICIFFIGLISEDNIITRVLKSRLFGILGKSSYIFYLIHLGVFHTFINRHITSNYASTFIILIGIAIVLFKWVEEPAHRWVKTLVKFPSS